MLSRKCGRFIAKLIAPSVGDISSKCNWKTTNSTKAPSTSTSSSLLSTRNVLHRHNFRHKKEREPSHNECRGLRPSGKNKTHFKRQNDTDFMNLNTSVLLDTIFTAKLHRKLYWKQKKYFFHLKLNGQTRWLVPLEFFDLLWRNLRVTVADEEN